MNFEEIIETIKSYPKKKVAIVAADDLDVLEVVSNAQKMGIMESVLIGDEDKIKKIADENNLDLSGSEIINEKDHVLASKIGVEKARDGHVDAIMKGQLHSSIIMKAILNKDYGIAVNSVISHVSIIKSPQVDRFLFVTDGAMTMYPDLKQKVEIINNAVSIARNFGIENPKVACLSALEVVNLNMPSTMDAAVLTVMNQRGQIKNCVVEGPLAFDNAVDMLAAKHKGVKSLTDVPGNADILLVPNIESGNILIKSSKHIGGCKTAGLLVGAKVPIILSSRADSSDAKLRSIACALYKK